MSRDKYILAGLRMYGDTLGGTLADPALNPTERAGFEADSQEVEALIKEYERKVQNANDH
jgi:hypothetical protein